MDDVYEVDFYSNPVDFQIPLLGLDIRDLIGKSVLDIGCGVGAELVRELRLQGVEAYGIDPLVKYGESWFSKKRILCNGDIPIGDNFFDAIVSFQNPALNSSLLLGRDYLKNQRDISPKALDFLELETNAILSEIRRTLKPGGTFYSYPHLKLAKKRFLDLGFTDMDVSRAKPGEVEVFKYVFWNWDRRGLLKESEGQVYIDEGHRYRTEVRKRLPN